MIHLNSCDMHLVNYGIALSLNSIASASVDVNKNLEIPLPGLMTPLLNKRTNNLSADCWLRIPLMWQRIHFCSKVN